MKESESGVEKNTYESRSCKNIRESGVESN